MKRTAPIRLIVISFLLLIALGTALLALPLASASGGFTHPLDALFTATSATCVTGLSVVDTTSHWSPFGQAVVLGLIQLGGLGLSTFATGFSLLVHRRLGLREMLLTGEASGSDMPGAAGLLKLMLGFTFCCELLGAGLLMLRFVPEYGAAGVWPAVFVSVSAYCNAGFDILGFVPGNSSLTAFSGDPLVCLTISALIATGGLGFVVVRDIYQCKLLAPLRGRGRQRLNFHSQICLRATLALLLGYGYTKLTLALNVARVFLFRVPVLWVLQSFTALGTEAVGLTMMISNICAGLSAAAAAIPVVCSIRRWEAESQSESMPEGR